MSEATPLESELALFKARKAEFLEKFPGLFVLVKGDEVSGPFASAEGAYEEGLRRYGLTAFLVKQVLAEEPVGFVPVLLLAH